MLAHQQHVVNPIWEQLDEGGIDLWGIGTFSFLPFLSFFTVRLLQPISSLLACVNLCCIRRDLPHLPTYPRLLASRRNERRQLGNNDAAYF